MVGLDLTAPRPGSQSGRSPKDGASPGDEEAQQVDVVGAGQQHDGAQGQLEDEEPADDAVDPEAPAQRQEVQVVDVGGDVRDPWQHRGWRASVNQPGNQNLFI